MPAKISQQKAFLFLLLIIFLLNVLVFYPSFFHPARADQLIYLTETAGFKDFGDLLIYSYSYPRHRLIYSGDAFLFRPLFYFFLSAEKALFGFNSFYWQITGFLFHLVVLAQLARILFFIRPQLMALLFVLNFSLFYVSEEMVIWHHINGYILFMIFILEAFYNSLRYIQNHLSPN